MSDGFWQWATRYDGGETYICEGIEGEPGTAEDEARSVAADNARARVAHPSYPACRVVKRWVQTGPWVQANEDDPGSVHLTLDNSDGRFYPDEPRRQWWECSHAGEPCRCDEMLICVDCTRKRWPNGPDGA